MRVLTAKLRGFADALLTNTPHLNLAGTDLLFYRAILSHMGEAYMLLDRDFHIVDLNEAALRIDTRPREQIVGRSHWAVYPGTEWATQGQMYKRVIRTGNPETGEISYAWPHGSRRWYEVRAFPIEGLLAVFYRDITDRKELEESARLSAERVQLALDAGAIVGTWVWEVPNDLFLADERFARSFGLSAEDCRRGLQLAAVMESIHPDDREKVSAAVSEALARGGKYRCEYRVRRSDGEFHWIEANGRVEKDSSGNPLRFPGVLLDIEERRRMEAERDRANHLLRTFIDAVPGVVYAKDLSGRIIVANRGVAELVGKPPEYFLGKTDAEFLEDKAQAATVMATDREVMDSGVTRELEETVSMPDGRPVVWLSTKSPLLDADGNVIGLIGTSVDITARKAEQEKAKREAELLEILNRTGQTLAAELDLESLLQSVTDAATALTGARFGAFFYNGTDERGEAYMLFTLCGAPREAFERMGHPRATPLFAPTFRGEPPIRLDDVLRDPRYGQWAPHHGMPAGHLAVRSYLAVPVVSRRGEVIGGLFFGHPEPGVFSERSERLATGLAAQAAIAIDNARLYAQAQSATVQRDLLLESERAARAEAERASTLKDQFLATLSHELRTPLSAILGWTHILRKKLDPANGELLKGVDVIERSAGVQKQLIEDLLDMSRITSGKLALEMRPVSPRSFVHAATEALAPAAATAGVRVRTVVEEPVPEVTGDAARLQQVIWNLLSNAIKFSRAGGEVTVRVRPHRGAVEISVADQGVGIREEFLPHVFERFRQADGSITRKHGGLGLGLSIAKHLVELHNGEIGAVSAGEGAGATFTVRLPVTGAAVDPSETSCPNSATGANLVDTRVVLVDDDPDVLDLLRRVLEDAGAQVLAVRSGAAALERLDEFSPDVLVSDIGMPGLDGYDFLRRARISTLRGREIPAIAITAFARPEDQRRAIDAGFRFHVTKPVDPADLVARIARCAIERRARPPAGT